MNLVLFLLRFLFGPALFGGEPFESLAIRPDGRLQPVSFRERLRHTRMPEGRRAWERIEPVRVSRGIRLLRMAQRILRAAGALVRYRRDEGV